MWTARWRGRWDISGPFLPFCCKSKTTLKYCLQFFKKKLLLKYSIFTYVNVENSSRSMALSLKM